MKTPEDPESVETNRLLGALPRQELQRLRPRLEVVELAQRDSIVEPGEPIGRVYFPTNCVVSMIAEMDDGQQTEVGTVGREGMLGLPLFLGRQTTPLRSFCQVPGHAARMSARAFREEVTPGSRLHELLRYYTEATFVFAAQSSACNRLHSIEQRAARWLLHTHDRVGGEEFSLTQEFLAQMLGVRRASVSEIAGGFQGAGLIRYSRGVIRVLDRAALEEKACECYRIITREFDRLPE